MRKKILSLFLMAFMASNVYGADCPEGYEKMDISGPGFGGRGLCAKLEKIVDGNSVTEIYTQATHYNAVQNVVWSEETFTIKREYDNQGRPIYEEGKGNTRSTTYGDNTLLEVMTYADGSSYESSNVYNSDGKEISSQVRTYDTEGNFIGLDFYTYEYQGNEESYNLVGYDTNGRPRSVEGNLFSVENGEFYEYEYEWQEDEDGNVIGGKKNHSYTGEILENCSFDENGNMIVYDASDENLEKPRAKYGAFGEILETYEYDANGKRTTYDKNGNKIRSTLKRIYTIEEATKLSKPTGNKIMIRYK